MKIKLRKIKIQKGLHIGIDAIINDHKVFLIIDTGASQSVLDLKSIKDLIPKNKIDKQTMLSTGLGTNSMESNATKIETMEIGKLILKNKKFMLLDLSHINETYKSLKKTNITGVIGGDFLQKYRAIIDYKKLILQITE